MQIIFWMLNRNMMTLYHNINVWSGHDAEHLFYIVQLKKKKTFC